MNEGDIPFKYLGVPLHSKKLNFMECRGVINKITARLNSRAVKLLSYGRRLELVRSVLTGTKNFWAQLFTLPKKVIKKVEGLCRSFLWSGNKECANKALVA